MINKQYDALVTSWINNNRSKILERWMELIRIPSIKSEAKENAPFGEECSLALKKSASFFSEDGFKTSIYENEGYALAEYGSGEKSIGLFCHGDVVPVGEDWIFTKPFEPIIKDGSLIGRGAEDNKSGIIASMCVYNFLRDNNIPLKSKIKTFIGSDEECGMQDIQAYLNEHKIPDLSIVPDADFPCSVGEKGIYHLWLEHNNKFDSVINFFGGEAFNIVLDRAQIEIRSCDKLYAEIQAKIADKPQFTLNKCDDTITLSAKGVAKHASVPEGSQNAAYLICELLCSCEYFSENDKDILSSASVLLGDYYGAGLDCEHCDTNFGKLTCVNGMVKAENGKLSLSFDIRYGDTLEPQVLVDKSTVAAEKQGFKVTFASNSPGFSIDKDSKIPDALEEIFFEVTGDKLERILMSGGTYARKLKNAFSIGTFYITKERESEVLSMPDGHGGPHQCDERIDIEGFFTALRVLIHYIISCDEILNS